MPFQVSCSFLSSTHHALVLVSFAVGAVCAGYFAFHWIRRRKRSLPQDTLRLKNFSDAVGNLDWGSSTLEDLQKLSESLVALFQAEIDYYYWARATSRNAARWFRISAFALGTIGVLCPLLEGIAPMPAGILSKLGYVFLAAAAASLAGNELFGGTERHVRYVSTQYRIEELMQQFNLDWNAWKAGYLSAPAQTRPAAKGAIDMMKKFDAACHKAIREETIAWGRRALEAEQAYGRSLRRPSGKSG